MEKNQMNRSGCRPYNRTCGMSAPARPMPVREITEGKMPCEGERETTENRMPCRGERKEDAECRCEMRDGMECRCKARPGMDCRCRMPGRASGNTALLEKTEGLPCAMAYVPCQEFTGVYDLSFALRVGTIFPQLCKPFCGMRGGRR